MNTYPCAELGAKHDHSRQHYCNTHVTLTLAGLQLAHRQIQKKIDGSIHALTVDWHITASRKTDTVAIGLKKL